MSLNPAGLLLSQAGRYGNCPQDLALLTFLEIALLARLTSPATPSAAQDNTGSFAPHAPVTDSQGDPPAL